MSSSIVFDANGLISYRDFLHAVEEHEDLVDENLTYDLVWMSQAMFQRIAWGSEGFAGAAHWEQEVGDPILTVSTSDGNRWSVMIDESLGSDIVEFRDAGC